MPTDLAQTSAFAPRRHNLSTESDFIRTYEVPGLSVVQVRGRELGSQHRDLVYAIFRLPAQRVELPTLGDPGPRLPPKTIGDHSGAPMRSLMIVECTWRDILEACDVSVHTNNLATVLRLMEEVRQVSFTVFRGEDRSLGGGTSDRRKARSLGAGFSNTLLGNLAWSGDRLDSSVTIHYPDWIREMVEHHQLVPVSGSYFRLKSEYAKSILPYIDSEPGLKWVDEKRLAQLTGRDLALETAKQRGKFREEVRQAFADIVRVGGLLSVREERIEHSGEKSVRFHLERADARRRQSRRS